MTIFSAKTKRSALATAAGAAMLATGFAPLAEAVTLVNRDQESRTVEVKQGGRSETVTVRAGQTLQNICGQGCEIHLGNEFVSELAAQETIVIEGGYLGFGS